MSPRGYRSDDEFLYFSRHVSICRVEIDDLRLKSLQGNYWHFIRSLFIFGSFSEIISFPYYIKHLISVSLFSSTNYLRRIKTSADNTY